MPEKHLEEIVVALDCSRSMGRTDYTPNRFMAAKKALLAFVQTRLKNEAATQIALVSFGEKVKVVCEFTNQLNEIEEAMKEITVCGKSPLGNALGITVQMLIGELRKAGARNHRILLISDGKASKTSIDPIAMARLCSGLNIVIDVIRIGQADDLNVLKRLAQMTNGQFFYCSDENNVVATAIKLGQQVNTAKSTLDRDEAKIAPLLAQIAGNLLKVSDLSQDQKSVIDNILGKNSDKCVICFQTDDPVTKAPFNISGRYCPNCNNPMHLSCASMWAEQDTKRASKEIFRCPHCFYLLKIPTEVHKTRLLHEQMKNATTTSSSTESGKKAISAKRAIARDLGDAAIYSACPVCHNIFEEDEVVMACGNEDCNAIYHADCFSKLEGHQCKKCGLKFT